MTAPGKQAPPDPPEAELAPLADPGKADRSAHGIPVVPAYDGYRAAAVLAVVLFHVLAASRLLLKAGDSLPAQLIWGTLPYGISVFFIVSGFVMFLPTAARDGEFGSPRVFAIRRAARLFPAMWVALLIVLALLLMVPDVPQPYPGPGEILLNFSGQAGWATLVDASQAAGFGVDTPVYTLTIELAFYLVLPFVALAYFRRPLVGLAIAAVIAILWREAFAHIEEVASWVNISLDPRRVVSLQFANNQFPLWAFSFAAGMTSAWAYVHLPERVGRRTMERWAPIALAVSFAAVLLCAYLSGRYVIGRQPGAVIWTYWQSSFLALSYTAALAALMLAIPFASERVRRPFGDPRTRVVADISYGVYLIHAVLIWLLIQALSPPQDGRLTTFLIMMVLVVPLSLGYGYLSTRFVEQPIRRWARRFGRSGRKRPTEPAPAGSSGVVP